MATIMVTLNMLHGYMVAWLAGNNRAYRLRAMQPCHHAAMQQ